MVLDRAKLIDTLKDLLIKDRVDVQKEVAYCLRNIIINCSMK